MILESIVTTVDESGEVNLAPMGPVVDPSLTRFLLRPFHPSRTHDNLRATRRAVIHVTDDVLLYARAVAGGVEPLPAMHPVGDGDWWVIDDACRYFAVEVERWRDGAQRADAECRVVESAEMRPFFGFNRAKHAVIEAAILATRTHLIDAESIAEEMRRLEVLVDKTAGDRERQAFELLKTWIEERIG